MTDVRTEPPPTTLARKYARYLVGFGVWFVVGLAPFLGKLKVPLFSALIEIYPADMQGWLIPLSGIFMGMMAVIVEFVYAKNIAARRLTRWFVGSVVAFGVSFVLLLVLYLFFVSRVDKTIVRVPGGQPERISIAVVTGTPEVPLQRPGSKCECIAGEPAEKCLGDISLNPSSIRQCFGVQRVALATLALSALYLLLTGSFAAAVGLVLLSQRPGRIRRKRRQTPDRDSAPRAEGDGGGAGG